MRTTRFLSAAPRRAARATVLTLTLAAALAAMGPTRAEAQTATPRVVVPAVAKRRSPAELLVENGNWLDAHVYLVRDGMLTSLGFVGALGKERLVLPSLATATGSAVQILVLPIGGTDAYLSPDIVINPGDDVELLVENQLSLSTLSVLPVS